MPATLRGEVYDTCPKRLSLDEPADFNKALRLWALYDKGILPESGGLNDQNHLYLELMAIVGGAVDEIQAEHTAEMKAASKRGANG